MGACAGKHNRCDNESKRKQKRRVRIYPAHKKGEKQRLLDGCDEQKRVPSRTWLYDLPLEMLDIILQKSYLNWSLNSSGEPTDAEIIRSLSSVDVCFHQRITRRRFKKAIWRRLADFYEKSRKRLAIIRHNKGFLLRTIEPNDVFVDALFSLDCLTTEQHHFIHRQRTEQDRNAELLRFLQSFDDRMFSDFVKCLRLTNQTTVTRIVENGGVVLEVKLKACCITYSAYLDSKLLRQGINQLNNETTQRSDEAEKLNELLNEKGVEILSSPPKERRGVSLWIWCRSQAALDHIQRLYKANQLTSVLYGLANIEPTTSEITHSRLINIDRNQFKKAVVVCPLIVNFTERIEVENSERVLGVTKLRNEIYVLCRSSSPNVIRLIEDRNIFRTQRKIEVKEIKSVVRVFEDRNLFRLRRKIEIREIKSPVDIGSSEKENCLYICDSLEKSYCVWKVIIDTIDQNRIIKWLTVDYEPLTLSVSSGGQLLMVSGSSSTLMVYGSDAELIRAVKLPGDIEYPRHAVETSLGNFIIIHDWIKRWKVDSRSSEKKWGISEVTRDGQTIVRRFVSSNHKQTVKNPEYLSIDSDDRVFVADYGNDRVILLDSDLRWNRILCPTEEEGEVEEEEAKRRFMKMPWSLYYDEVKRQLIVGGDLHSGQGIKVYTFDRK